MKVAIIGGGIVGLATAHEILLRHPSIQVIVLEKEAGPGRHQTGHNSGVMHCGLYYRPGSARARMAVSGIRRMAAFCEQQGVPYELCGKTVIATRPEEVPRLHALLERGTANGLEGLRLLRAEEIREYEPHAAGLAAILVPQEGITDYAAVAEAMAKEIRARGGEIRVSSQVTRLVKKQAWVIQTSSGDYEADFLINCAGLQSDRVGRLGGVRDATKIVPFRGEFYMLKPERQYLVKNLIYPTPDPAYPFLGVHFMRRIRGGVECGPNASMALAREGYRQTDFSLRDTAESLTFPGFWKFLLRHRGMCWNELKHRYSKKVFCRSLQRLVPEIQIEDLVEGGCGVRAQALSPAGNLLDDFQFARGEGALHVLNAPSPAATAALAIADEVVNQSQEALGG